MRELVIERYKEAIEIMNYMRVGEEQPNRILTMIS